MEQIDERVGQREMGGLDKGRQMDALISLYSLLCYLQSQHRAVRRATDTKSDGLKLVKGER